MNHLTEEQKNRNVQIGRSLKTFLKRKGISVNQLAEEVGMKANNISRSLSGRYTMPKKVVTVLIEKYGLDETFFDNGKDEAKKDVLLSFSQKEYASLRFLAAKEKKTVSALIIDAVREKYGEKLDLLEKL